MDALYWGCVVLAGAALVLISAVIPWAVYTRYVLNRAASWPEPFAVLLTIVLTFFGAAACYRRGQHMNIAFFTGMLPDGLRRAVAVLAETLVGLFALFMVIYGTQAGDRDLAQHDRRFPGAVGRRHLSADPDRRRDPVLLRRRAHPAGPPPAAREPEAVAVD